MSKTIDIDGTSYEASVRLESLTLVEAAYRGEVGMGGMIVDDPDSSLTVPALRAAYVTETEAAVPRVWTGFTQARTVRRGKARTDTAREWDVELYDVNVLLDDYILGGSSSGDDADRPAETDMERVAWLLTTRINSIGGLSGGSVTGTSFDMDASDYRGKTPREVLEDCAEKAHKNFFVYRYGSGPLLYYGKHTSTNLTSSARISTELADVDSVTTWAAVVEPTGVRLDPDRVYSSIRLKYKGGVIRRTDAGTAAAFRHREKSMTNTRAKTADRAGELADKYLEACDTEKRTFSVSLRLPTANVNDIRAGERVEVKAPYMGIPSFTFKRVTRRIVSPAMGASGLPTDRWWHVRLEFWDDVRPTRFVAEPEDWEEKSNATEDDANVVMDRNGITVTGGAITVVNGNDVLIIDGSSDILSVVASGTFTVPQNETQGDVKRSTWIRTDLAYDPMSMWSIRREGGADGDWSQVLPLVVHNTSGQIIEYYGGRARHQQRGVDGTMRDGTEVQAIKGSTSPPLAARQYRFRILRQTAL